MRIVWRLTAGRRLPGVGSPVVRTLAAAVHVGLYLLLGTVVALGIANAFNRGIDLYGLGRLPQLGDPTLKKSLTQAHGLAANILIALAGLHASAALAHHYLWRDGVLRRMRPGSA